MVRWRAPKTSEALRIQDGCRDLGSVCPNSGLRWIRLASHTNFGAVIRAFSITNIVTIHGVEITQMGNIDDLVSVCRVLQMQGTGHADVLGCVLQVPGNTSDVVPYERLRAWRVSPYQFAVANSWLRRLMFLAIRLPVNSRMMRLKPSHIRSL